MVLKIQLPRLVDISASILRAVGTPEYDARVVAGSLVRAEARGQSSHGVRRLDTYVQRIQAGLIRVGTSPTTVLETSGVAVLDAGAGFGHVAGIRAMELCTDKARNGGIGAVAVRNSTHFGIASVFAERATESDCIGIATTNGAAWMPPVGAKSAVLGTNPIAIAVPGPAKVSFTLDMATGVVALGKILAARDSGERIPLGWALTRDGIPTTDSAAAADGLILPMAGPKGFGLALALEVLSAVLGGASVGQSAGSMYRTWDRSEDLGHFFVAILIDAFRPRKEFDDALRELVSQVRSAQPSQDSSPIWLPGEMEAERERSAEADGLPISETMRSSLERAAATAGLALTL